MFSIRASSSCFSLDRAHERRNLFQTGELGGAPAAFSRDNLVLPGWEFGYGDRLNQTIGADGLCELLELLRVKRLARLSPPGLNLIDRDALKIFEMLGQGRFGRWRRFWGLLAWGNMPVGRPCGQ